MISERLLLPIVRAVFTSMNKEARASQSPDIFRETRMSENIVLADLREFMS